MNDEKLFQYLVSRVQVRETSTLTLTSITSSASVILWGLFYSLESTNIEIIRVIGIVLPILGFAYFEILFATQQRWDYDEINKMIKIDTKDCDHDNLEKIIYGKNRNLVIPKIVIWKILLSAPIIGWSYTFGISYMVITILFISMAILLITGINESHKDKIINKS